MSETNPARFFSEVGATRGMRFEIAAEATIGRSDDNAIPLALSAISRRHARIAFDPQDGCYVLEDLDSRNGTAVDGVRVTGRERLGYLHVISLAGEHDFIFLDPALSARRHPQRQAEAADEAPAGTVIEPLPPTLLPPALAAGGGEKVESDAERTRIEPAVVPVPELKPAPPPAPEPAFALEITDPPELRRRYDLHPGKNLVGRGDGARLQLRSSEVSRRHALVLVEDGKVTVEDLGSQNHTYLDGERITDLREVAPGALVRFGAVKARLRRVPVEEDER